MRAGWPLPHTTQPSTKRTSITQSHHTGRHLRNSQEVEAPSIGLSDTLGQRLALPLGRLKTGTPPRLDGRTIDWAVLEPQPSDDPPRAFSYLNAERGVALKDRLIQVGRQRKKDCCHACIRVTVTRVG